MSTKLWADPDARFDQLSRPFIAREYAARVGSLDLHKRRVSQLAPELFLLRELPRGRGASLARQVIAGHHKDPPPRTGWSVPVPWFDPMLRATRGDAGRAAT